MFLICGEALFDLFAAPSAQGPITLTARAGGSPFNVAIAMARLGARAALFTGMADDMFGRRLRADLAVEGVETGYLRMSGGKTTLSLVEIAEDGGPGYRFYGEDGAERLNGVSETPALADDVFGLHFGSYAMVIEPAASVHLALARREAERRIISYDPNVRLGVEPDRGLWARRVEEMAALADIVKLSAEDAALLWPDAPFGEVLARLRGLGASLVIGTEGAKGARALGAFGEARVPARVVEVADTVGAGDAFQAAILAGVQERGLSKAALAALDRRAAEAMMRFAVEVAGETCARVGADTPRLAEISRS